MLVLVDINHAIGISIIGTTLNRAPAYDPLSGGSAR